MRRQFSVFVVRWLLSSFGLWLSVRVFGTGYSESQIDSGLVAFLGAGLLFSVVNSVLKPIVVVLSLPAILLTLGLFTIFVNGFMVYISLLFVPGLHMKFFHAVLTGIVLSLINYIVSSYVELRRLEQEEGNRK